MCPPEPWLRERGFLAREEGVACSSQLQIMFIMSICPNSTLLKGSRRAPGYTTFDLKRNAH